MFKALTPDLLVDDVAATVAWYNESLGFETVVTVPEAGQLDFAIVRRDDVQLMFQSRRSMEDDFNARGETRVEPATAYYFDITGLGDLMTEIGSKAEVLNGPYETFYGTREVLIRDCNGHLMVLAEQKTP